MEETKYQQAINECPIKHIAFIMDGNGRWAKKRMMPREFGHKAGANVFRKIMKHCCERGIKASTYYVFSTENWKRPKKEVDAILELLDQYLEECIKEQDVYYRDLYDLRPPKEWEDGGFYYPLFCPECAKAYELFMKGGESDG